MSKVLVCGGRKFNDQHALEKCLDSFHAYKPVTLLIHGGAHGADRMAGNWASKRGIHPVMVPALWASYGGRAGPLRNQAMLLLSPDVVIAFPGGSGTADMVSKARTAGIIVYEVC